MLLLSSADFFKINFFKKLFQEHYESVKRFRSGSGPTWVQTVYKGYLYQQTTKLSLQSKELTLTALTK